MRILKRNISVSSYVVFVTMVTKEVDFCNMNKCQVKGR